MEKKSKVSSVLGGSKPTKKSGGKKSGGKHKVKRMTIHHAKNGGYIISHDMENEPDETGESSDPEEHIAPNKASLLDHVSEHMDQPEAGPEPSPSPYPAGAPPAPPAAPAAPAAPAGPVGA